MTETEWKEILRAARLKAYTGLSPDARKLAIQGLLKLAGEYPESQGIADTIQLIKDEFPDDWKE